MPPTSLVRYSNRGTSHNGQRLFWDRVGAGADSLPFRGPFAPTYRDEEFEERTVRVADYRNAFFDVAVPAQNADFRAVMECCCNGWFRLVHLERFWVDERGNRTTRHYVEWAEYYLEDGSRTAYLTPGVMELANGQHGPFGPAGAG